MLESIRTLGEKIAFQKSVRSVTRIRLCMKIYKNRVWLYLKRKRKGYCRISTGRCGERNGSTERSLVLIESLNSTQPNGYKELATGDDHPDVQCYKGGKL